MFAQSLPLFVNWFANPNFVAMGLAIVFGLFWYALYRPPLRDYGFLWGVMAVSAILTLIAIAFIQVPLQILTQQLTGMAFDQATIVKWLFFLGIPIVLLSGLVQEGAKMLPMVFVWQRADRNISPVVGIVLGAAAGAGFGIFEAMWAHNQVFAAGFTWASVEAGGFSAIIPFWERFFTIGGHIAFSALAGYGLARDKGWLFFLIAAGLHSLMNYTVILLQAQLITMMAVEMLVAAVAVGATVWVLLLRYGEDGAPWSGGHRRRLHLGKEPSEYAKQQ